MLRADARTENGASSGIFVTLGLLCIGPVDRFYETPLLIQQQWRQARPVPALFTENNWAPSWNTDTSATTEQPLHS